MIFVSSQDVNYFSCGCSLFKLKKKPKNIFLEKGLAINRQKIHSIVISRSAITPFDFAFPLNT
jgi:hypothetical protein